MLLKKIYTLTLILFIIITIYTIPIVSLKNKNVIKTNLEIEKISLPTTKIYLLNKDNYLVQREVILDTNNIKEKIKTIIDYLTIEENKDSNLKGLIPKNTKLLEIKLDSNIVILNFSKEFLSKKEMKKEMITGIVYSLLELETIEKISFLVDGKEIEGLEKEYDKNLSINPIYQYHTRNNLSKVDIFLL
ncbi:MAG: GerMN domain-containing protein, partial [Bacilli bacterium]|nr:GerMN domain-containing protein [Bacilli bacterium]